MQNSQRNRKIYFDTCCFNRPFDVQTQTRVRREAEAVEIILEYFDIGYWQWLASSVNADEINRITEPIKHAKVKTLLSLAHQIVWVGEAEIARGEQLEAFGFEPLDALHLACAESGNADIFLTTDDSLLKTAKRVNTQLRVQVEYPDTWLQEETGHEYKKYD